MSMEFITTIATFISVSIVLAGLIITGQTSLRREMQNQREEINGLREEINDFRGEVVGLREKVAHLQGMVEGFFEAVTNRRVAEDPGQYDAN